MTGVVALQEYGPALTYLRYPSMRGSLYRRVETQGIFERWTESVKAQTCEAQSRKVEVDLETWEVNLGLPISMIRRNSLSATSGLVKPSIACHAAERVAQPDAIGDHQGCSCG